MSVIKSLKIKQADGTFGEAINLGAKAENISIKGEGSSLDLQKFLRTRPVKYYGSFSDAIFEAQFIPKEEALVSDPAGEIIVTDGFYTRYDGGAGIYRMIRDTVIHEDTTQDLEQNTNIYFKWDNTKQRYIFQPTGTSVTFELVVFNNEINIKQIGAGVGTSFAATNNNVFAELVKAEHKIIIPASEFSINQAITVQDIIGLDIEGIDQNKSKITFLNPTNTSTLAANGMIQIGDSLAKSNSNIIIRNLTLKGSTNVSSGIKMYISSDSGTATIENVSVENTRDYGLDLHFMNKASIKNICIDNCGSGLGIYNTNDSYFENIQIEGCQQTGCYLGMSNNNTINKININTCGMKDGVYNTMFILYAAKYNSIFDLSIKNCWFMWRGISITGATQFNTISNIFMKNNNSQATSNNSIAINIDGQGWYNRFLNFTFEEVESEKVGYFTYASTEQEFGNTIEYTYKTYTDKTVPQAQSYLGDAHNTIKGNISSFGSSRNYDDCIVKVNNGEDITGLHIDVINGDYHLYGYLKLSMQLNTNSSLFKLHPYSNLGKWLGRTYFPLYDETNKKTYLAVINNEIVQLSSSEAIPAGTYKIDIVLPRQIAY